LALTLRYAEAFDMRFSGADERLRMDAVRDDATLFM